MDHAKNHPIIGVIGLRPRQMKDVYEMTTIDCVKIFDAVRISPLAVKTFASKVDHVIMLTEHVPSKVHRAVPKEKLTLVTGNVGISKVKQVLGDVLIDLGETIPRHMDPVDSVQVEASPVSDASAELPADWISSTLVTATTGYRHLPDVNVTFIENRMGVRVDRRIMQAGVPGDVFRMTYVGPMNPTEIGKLSAARNYYSNVLGKFIEVHLYRKYVDMYVSDVTHLPSSHRAYTITDRQLMIAAMRLKPAIAVPTQTTSGDALPIDSTAFDVVPSTTALVPAVDQTTTPEQREFWKEVFFIKLRLGGTVDTASKEADAALALYSKLC